MRLSPLFAIAAVSFALAPLACASDPADDNTVTPPEEGYAEDELRGFAITEADNGKTVTVTDGQDVLVKLPSNPSTGYQWKVVSTNRTFGYPADVKFLPNGGGVGSGGVERFTWKTKNTFRPMLGEHTVKMEYARSWETDVAPAKTFSFTVKVVAGECPQLSPPSPDFCKDGTLKVRKNEAGCTSGYDCVQDCRAKGCGSSSSCQLCWGSFACVPNGALC
jgi:inhibitor of cysteine peptidase